MRTFWQAVVVVILALATSDPSFAGGKFRLFSGSWGDVIVVTDVTPAGRVLTPPTKEQPVYYLGRTLGCRLGSIPGDRMPDDKELSDFTAKILARQGYLGAKPGMHEPTLFLVLQWGYLRPGSDDLLWFLGYNPSDDIAAPALPGQLGPDVWRRGFRSREIETILESASGEIYGVIVTAFEYGSARTPNPTILWQTRMGLPARGKSMAQALPAMIHLAGPHIGRETSSPVLRDCDDRYVGSVEFGELEVIEDEDDADRTGGGIRQ